MREAYHRRCLALIADLEDAEAAFGGAKPKGLLRVDVHGTLARHFVLPRLPDFLAEYPGIQVYMSEGDRLVDLVREGIDCVVRVGDLHDSDMIARRVGMLAEVTCAAPGYIEQPGRPCGSERFSRMGSADRSPSARPYRPATAQRSTLSAGHGPALDLIGRPRSLNSGLDSRAGARARRGRGSVGAFTRRPTRSRPRSASRH
jgi:DNA-binding transcriptional LysR family regulator